MLARLTRSTRGLLGVVVLLGLAIPAFAQNAGSLRGTVTDPSGSPVPGASVVVTNEATKAIERQGVSDAKGEYFFASLTPASYTIQVSVPGFKVREITGVRLAARDTLGVDVRLEVGGQTEVVQVTADVGLIQTETGAREGRITAAQIENISMVSRNPLELMRLLPGVVTESNLSNLQTVGKFDGASGGDVAVNGARPQNMSVTLDGANLRDIGANSGTMIVPNSEMVDEIKVQSSNYAAEFGTSAVGVRIVTKGGGAEFHGTLYDYWRPAGVQANDWSTNAAGQKRPDNNYNYPGFNVSGPILIPGTSFNKHRDKAFFFFGSEWSFQKFESGTYYGITPTLGMRQGMFNDYQAGQNLNQPTNVNIPPGYAGAGSHAPNNDLSPYLDPFGVALLNLYPLPNYNDPNNRYNYVFNQPAEKNRNQQVLRLDFHPTERTRLFVRLARDKDVQESPRGLWWTSSGVELPTPVQWTGLGRTATAGLTNVLSPTITNELIVSYAQLKNDNTYKDPSKMKMASYPGMTGFSNPYGASAYVPQIINDWSTDNGSLWSVNDVDSIFSYNSAFSIEDHFTKIMGPHAAKAGFLVQRLQKEQNLPNTANVQLHFWSWAGNTGSYFGDIATGKIAQANFGTAGAIGNFVSWDYEAYLQDSWKVTHNFTLEAGLRFGKWGNVVETNDLAGIFLPDRYDQSKGTFLDAAKTQVNGVAYVNKGEVGSGLTADRPFIWLPRLNFVWDITGTGSTILRGGGGRFVNRDQTNAQVNAVTLAPNAYASTIGKDAGSSLGGGKGLTYSTLGEVDPLARTDGFGVSTPSPYSLDWPQTWNVSLSLAQRLPWKQIFEVGYVGTFGKYLSAQQAANVIQPGALLQGTIGNSDLSVPVNRVALSDSAVNSQRPYPGLSSVTYSVYKGTSNYNALQATLSRQSGKFQYYVAYTFSKMLGTRTADFSTIDPFDPANRSYGYGPYDRTHIFSASWSLNLGSPVKDGIAGYLVNDWNLSGVSSFTSGTPIYLTLSGAINTDGVARAWYGTSDYTNDVAPVFNCDPRLSGAKKPGDKILDVNCIGLPEFGQTGSQRQPYYMRSPNRWSHDLSVFKNFGLGGKRQLQARVGVFNVFNQAYPSYYPGGSSDIDLTLDTACNVTVNGVPNGSGGKVDSVCDPTKGFHFTDNTLANFGKIITKRGHRVIEFALRVNF
jgi:hypothetical protein